MFLASLYIIVCTARNRLRMRLKRLREPRYLFGAIAGIAYFYFAVFARMRSASGRRGRRRPSPPPDMMAAFVAAGPPAAGLLLMVLTALLTVLPMTSSLLVFSEPEIQFLFPAPVTRRQLLLHRMLRSQLGILFGIVIFSIFVPASSGFSRLRTGLAMCLMFATGKVYFAGIAMAKSRFSSVTPSARRLAWAPVVLLVMAIVVTGAALGRAFAGSPVANVQDALGRFSHVAANPLVRTALFPFVALVQPFFAVTTGQFLLALLPAATVLVAVASWVVRTDEGFEEAVAEASARQAAVQKARVMPAPSARVAGWTLGLTGSIEGLFFWKNGLHVLRGVTGLALLRFAVPIVIIVVSLSSAVLTARGEAGIAMVLCSVAVYIVAFTVLLGPQVVRSDLRDDLRHMEVLKTWPLRAAAVIRGEMLFPGAALTAIAWLALTCAAILSAAGFPRLSIAWRLSGAASAFLLTPALIFAQLTVHNAAAVLFPAWVPLGSTRPRGLDAMGQRLILFGAVMLTLAVMMLPGLLAGAILWFAFYRFVGPPIVVAGAMISLVVVLIEVLTTTEALGPAFERLDVLAIERPE